MEGKQNFTKFPVQRGQRPITDFSPLILGSTKLQQQTLAAINYGAPLFPPFSTRMALRPNWGSSGWQRPESLDKEKKSEGLRHNYWPQAANGSPVLRIEKVGKGQAQASRTTSKYIFISMRVWDEQI